LVGVLHLNIKVSELHKITNNILGKYVYSIGVHRTNVTHLEVYSVANSLEGRQKFVFKSENFSQKILLSVSISTIRPCHSCWLTWRSRYRGVIMVI